MAEGSRLASLVGPFYARADLLGWLDLSDEELDRRVLSGHLIECVTSDGLHVYPTFQFDENGELFAGVSEVAQRFATVGLVGGWSVAKWLCVPNPGLPDGSSAIEWLASGRDSEPVMREARRDAARRAGF